MKESVLTFSLLPTSLLHQARNSGSQNLARLYCLQNKIAKSPQQTVTVVNKLLAQTQTVTHEWPIPSPGGNYDNGMEERWHEHRLTALMPLSGK
jgi:hypothetical protein